MSMKPTSTMKRRLNGAVAAVLVVFSISIVLNLLKISVSDSAKYQTLANEQQFRSRTIHANRGSIVDRNGQVLAQSATVYTVFIDPTMLKTTDSSKKDKIVNSLSEILELKKEDVIAKAQKESKYEILKQKVEKPVADKVIALIKDNDLSCIGCDPDTKRYYPQNDLAASVVGFTNYDGKGQYGLEFQYDEYLSGIDGRIISAKDAVGQDMPYRYEQNFAPQDGDTLVLNIDNVLQHYLERELKKTVTVNKATGRGCGIIMNAKTGQILAMATEPDFDLNNPAEITDPTTAAYLETLKGDEKKYNEERAIAWDKQWKNKAVTEIYYPGSVFKVITGSSALEEKKITLTEKFNCGGSINVAGTTFHCWSHKSHGAQTFVQAMTNSCNPAFIQIGQKLGADLFSQYFSAYGLDSKTGIDLPYEVSSLYQPRQGMGPVELSSCSFGQTNKVTPIEMLTAYAAVINGGNLVTPYVVDKIVDSKGNVVKQFEPVIKRQVISEETSATMRVVLESVVKTNGGTNAYIPGYRIGGKSGTSQKQDQNNITGKQDYVSSYVAFAPANDPQFIMLFMVDNPTGAFYYGSRVAAPYVSAILKDALPYLGYFPEYTEEEYAKMAIEVPDLTGRTVENATSTLSKLSTTIKVEKVGNGTKVVRQVPTKGNAIPRSGKIILYTDTAVKDESITVPDVMNKSLQEANTAITNAGLNFKPVGGAVNHKGAYVSQQNYPAGTKVPRGTIIEVTIVANDETG